jgi:hypothetical protein
MGAGSRGEAWRDWPREGDRLLPPRDASPADCIAAMWELSCEAYGIGPEDATPMRREVVRKGWMKDLRNEGAR